jgi:hypothetical protein
LKSIEEARSSEVSNIPEHVAESVAGQNILVDLRISELLDTAAKLFDRALRQPSAIIEESADLAKELQKVANGQSNWTIQRNDKRFNDPAWTENTFYKSLLHGYMAWSQSAWSRRRRAAQNSCSRRSAKHSRPQISY